MRPSTSELTPVLYRVVTIAASNTRYLMWSPAGPSWLVEHQPPLPSVQVNTTQSSVDYSPPTKWPRATTPVNTRTADSFLLGTSADSGVGLNLTFNSPPFVNKVDQNRMSPGLRTPTSRPGIHMNATPSPFRSFRLSSFTSPTFSDRALRLSNSENVVGFRFRGGSIEKPQRIAEMAPSRVEDSGTNSVSRSLHMPSTSDTASLDQTIPMIMGDLYDSHVDSMIDDSGLFCGDVGLHATSTPLRSPPQPYANSAVVAPVPNPYADLCIKTDPSETSVSAPSPIVMKSSPPTPSSFKRAMRDVQRQGILQPRKLLDDVNQLVRKRKGSISSDYFEPPKKPLKPYSRRWMRLATGGTQSQKELTAAAHAFIERTPRFKDSW
ncbi:hypothetical protein Aduo_012334 [Ancylostoma duodenale]